MIKLKAAIYYGPNNIRYEDYPKPIIKENEALVEMKACGICGSDLMDWYIEKRAPLVLGHEPAGIIVEIGDKVKKFQLNDKVFVHHHVSCLTCHYCTHGSFTVCPKFRETHIDPGGFAEYFRVPAENLEIDTIKIPNELSFEEATLIEPIACCIRGIMKCNIKPGDVATIVGAGPSGIIFTQLLKIYNASIIIAIDSVKYRLEMAKKFGADIAINFNEEDPIKIVRENSDNRGADIVIVTAPSVSAYSEALKICRKGGAILVFAPIKPNEFLPLSIHDIFFSEISLIPSYSTSHIETRMALNLILSNRIKAKELITHRFNLNQVGEAIKLAKEGKENLKIIILNE